VRRRAHRGRAVVYLGREGEGDLRGDPGVLAKERHVGAEAASARRLAHPAEEERRERRAVDALTLRGRERAGDHDARSTRELLANDARRGERAVGAVRERQSARANVERGELVRSEADDRDAERLEAL